MLRKTDTGITRQTSCQLSCVGKRTCLNFSAGFLQSTAGWRAVRYFAKSKFVSHSERKLLCSLLLD